MSSGLARSAGVVLLAMLPAPAWSQQVPVTKIPMRAVASVNGKDLYKAYCEHCHGADGKGQGPMAPGLRVPPADLTTFAARNGGKFEYAAVEDKINGWKQVPRTMRETAERVNAMRTGENAQDLPVMPAFGPIFAKLYSQEVRDRQVRMSNIIRYVKSLQEKPPPQ